MIGAGLLARNAVERGLEVKPWVKTSVGPGSKVVMEYYSGEADRAAGGARLRPRRRRLHDWIGNSGPLPQEISDVVGAEDLAVVSVLSGNRNFEGRIDPDVKMNYLASPPLCVAYALAGTMDIDLLDEPLGTDRDGNDVYSRTSGRPPTRSRTPSRRRSRATCSPSPTARSSRATSAGTRSTFRRATARVG